MHETIQIYYKLNLVVPLRLLQVNKLKHRLARNVSQFNHILCSRLQYRLFTKKGWPVWNVAFCKTPGQIIIIRVIVAVKKKLLHPEFLTLICLHFTSWQEAAEIK